jgi:anion-transporting  ArsA/GET3 family ATPase
MLWLDKLSQLRQQIIEKREIISKIKFGNKEIESDKVLKNLAEQMEVYKKIQSLFLDPDRTEFNIVMNPDKLAISETELIMKKLNELNLPVHEIIMNKFLNETFKIPKGIVDKISQYYPLAEEPLIGMTALDNYLNKLD